MHDTAMALGRHFFETYLPARSDVTVVDIGAQDVNGSLRSVAPKGCNFIGVDFVKAKGVDIVITDPYSLPLADASADVVVCSSCFEHCEFFWLLFNEVLRVLKPNGLFYLSVPSNGDVHRYPVDCWRFYPDSGVALQNWARRSGFSTLLLESFVGPQKRECWNDFTAVFLKDAQFTDQHPARIQDRFFEFKNGLRHGVSGFANPAVETEDQQVLLGRRIWRYLRRRTGDWVQALPSGRLKTWMQVIGQPRLD